MGEEILAGVIVGKFENNMNMKRNVKEDGERGCANKEGGDDRDMWENKGFVI